MKDTSPTLAIQKRNIRLTVIGIIILMMIFLGLFLNKALGPREMSPEELRGQGVVLFEQPRIIKDFKLIDHNNKNVNLGTFENKLSFIFFGFTNCPDVCPTTLSDLSRIYNKLKPNIQKSIQIVLVSLDPARDTPEQLKAYIEYFNPDFSALTGTFPSIMSLTNNLNVAFNKVNTEQGYTIDHTSHIIIVNEHGHYAGFIKTPLATAQLPRIIESTLLPTMAL